MKTFKSVAALKAAAEKACKKTLNDQIKYLVEEKIGEKVDELVYESYSPVIYERRGGLSDTFESRMVGAYTINIYDSESANESVEGYPLPPHGVLAQWINDTGVPNVFNGKDYPWMHPRPFYDEAIEELDGSAELISVARAGFLANI